MRVWRDLQTRPAIKTHVLVDFIVEVVQLPVVNDEQQNWKLYVDRSSNSEGCGVGIVPQSLNGQDIIKCVLKLMFKSLNNEAKYEALFAGL